MEEEVEDMVVGVVVDMGEVVVEVVEEVKVMEQEEVEGALETEVKTRVTFQ